MPKTKQLKTCGWYDKRYDCMACFVHGDCPFFSLKREVMITPDNCPLEKKKEEQDGSIDT